MKLACPSASCDRVDFKSKQALRMHLKRGHGWSTKEVNEYLAPILDPAALAAQSPTVVGPSRVVDALVVPIDEIRALEDGAVIEGVAAAVGEMLLDGSAPYVIEIELDDDEILIAQACAYVDEHDDVASMIAAWLTESLAKFAELPSVKLALEARRVNDAEVA